MVISEDAMAIDSYCRFAYCISDVHRVSGAKEKLDMIFLMVLFASPTRFWQFHVVPQSKDLLWL